MGKFDDVIGFLSGNAGRPPPENVRRAEGSQLDRRRGLLAGMSVAALIVVCAFTAPFVLYVRGMDALLNSGAPAAWALLPIVLGVVGTSVGVGSLRRLPPDTLGRSLTSGATVLAVWVSTLTTLAVLFVTLVGD
jgi:hypothetical protein